MTYLNNRGIAPILVLVGAMLAFLMLGLILYFAFKGQAPADTATTSGIVTTATPVPASPTATPAPIRSVTPSKQAVFQKMVESNRKSHQ